MVLAQYWARVTALIDLKIWAGSRVGRSITPLFFVPPIEPRLQPQPPLACCPTSAPEIGALLYRDFSRIAIHSYSPGVNFDALAVRASRSGFSIIICIYLFPARSWFVVTAECEREMLRSRGLRK